MNESNYEQDLTNFRENFMNIRNIIKKTNGNTKFIKIENGTFHLFYEECKSEIEKIKNKIIKNSEFIDSMAISKSNKNSDDDNNIHLEKCGLIGG